MIRLCLPLLLSLLVAALNLSAQQNYNQTEPFLKANSFWAWYDNNGLDFSSGSPVHEPTALQQVTYDHLQEGVSSVSDPITGELLFYTDGRRVLDRNHNLMSNGDSLYGNFLGNAVQGSCIVPVIGTEDQYYLFSMGHPYDGSSPFFKGLYYSIVDMSLSGGNGGILATEKNMLIDTSTYNEAMIAIPGNNCNVWLLTHHAGSKDFLAYEISASGISPSPVVSQGVYKSLDIGYHLSVSPDRGKVSMTNSVPAFWSEFILNEGKLFSELLKFDPETGVLSDGIAIVPQYNLQGVPGSVEVCAAYTSAFSPNSEVLYITQSPIPDGYGYSFLAQFDLSTYDSMSINSSHSIIDTLPLGIDKDSLGISELYRAALKSYNDSIYIFNCASGNLSRINNPNGLGQTCDLQKNAISLPVPYETHRWLASAPNEVVYPVSSAVNGLVLDTGICEPYLLRPEVIAPGLSYVWQDGSTDTFFSIDSPGTYWVSYSYFEDNCIYIRTDSFRITDGEINPAPAININVNVLGTAHAYASYQWMKDGSLIPGAIDSTLTVDENGDYQVIVSNEFGCVDTSAIYPVTNQSGSGIYPYSKNEAIKIYPNPARDVIFIDAKTNVSFSLLSSDGKEIFSNQVEKQIDLRGLSQGVYLLKVFDRFGILIHASKITKLD